MATLSRAFLKGMNLTDEQQTAIIETHQEVLNGLKEELRVAKEKADLLPEVQKELDALKASSEKDGNWKEKYDKEHESFESYKAEIAQKEKTALLKSAYGKLLAECKVGESHIEAILKVTDFSNIKMDKDGKLENVDKLTESIKSEWSGFITTDGTKGADVDNPPAGGGAMNKEAFEKLPLSERMQYANAHPAEAAEFYK